MSLEEMMQEHGWYEETIGGQPHYVTRDEKSRSVIGPRRHRMTGFLRKRRGKVRMVDSNAETVVIDATGVELLTGWRARFYSVDFHKAVQHTAIDIAMWSSCAALAAVALKAAWFVVTL